MHLAHTYTHTQTRTDRQPEHPTSGELIHHWTLIWQSCALCSATVRKEVKLPNKTLSGNGHIYNGISNESEQKQWSRWPIKRIKGEWKRQHTNSTSITLQNHHAQVHEASLDTQVARLQNTDRWNSVDPFTLLSLFLFLHNFSSDLLCSDIIWHSHNKKTIFSSHILRFPLAICNNHTVKLRTTVWIII